MALSHLPTPADIPQIEYAQVFTASSILDAYGKGDELATFDLTIREMPGQRNFLLLAGIEEVISTLQTWKYDPTYLKFLLQQGLISSQFHDHLVNFSFNGDVWAVPEGTVVFPGEPVIRLTAPLKDANLFTAFLTIAICYPTLFLSKAARVRLAAGSKYFFVNGATRANSFENVFKLTRLSHIIGSSLAMPYVAQHFGIKKDYQTEVTLYHALIKAFPSENEAFQAILSHAGAQAKLYTMVDTYDFKTGLSNFIANELEARQHGQSLGRLLIDSGDLITNAQYCRRELDKAGLQDVLIAVESNLDEIAIAKLEAANAPIDIYGAVTEVITISDRPALDAVYKLAELRNAAGRTTYTAKLTPGKLSLPGRKQVYRNLENGRLDHDIIGLENEHLGTPLLKQYIKQGELIEPLPSIEEIKTHVESQLTSLPDTLRSIEQTGPYPVQISDKLQQLLDEVSDQHRSAPTA